MKKLLLLIGFAATVFVVMFAIIANLAHISDEDWIIIKEAQELAKTDDAGSADLHCIGISNEYSRYYCFREIAAIIAEADIDYAEQICDRVRAVYIADRSDDKCYFSIALHAKADENRVKEICNKINSYKHQQACIQGWFSDQIQ